LYPKLVSVRSDCVSARRTRHHQGQGCPRPPQALARCSRPRMLPQVDGITPGELFVLPVTWLSRRGGKCLRLVPLAYVVTGMQDRSRTVGKRLWCYEMQWCGVSRNPKQRGETPKQQLHDQSPWRAHQTKCPDRF